MPISWPNAGKCSKRWAARSSPGKPSPTTARGSIRSSASSTPSKGNCGFFEFPRLEALSHAAEDALADVRAGRRTADGPLVSAVLAIIDRIGEMVAAIEAGEDMPGGDDSALIDALAPGAESRAAPVAAIACAEAAKAAAAPRTIRLSVELLDRVMSGGQRHGAGAQRACPPACANPRTT